MSVQYCQGCGSPLSPGTTFCSNCGKSSSSNQQNVQQGSYSAPSYSPPPPQVNYYSSPGYSGISQQSYKDTPLSVGQYILMFILMSIPLVGFVLMLVWAFSSDTNTNKKNFSRAVLLMGVIVGILYAIVAIIIFIIAAASGGMSGF